MAPLHRDALLRLSGLDAFWGDGHVLHEISFGLGVGEAVALLGRNGAGKSTLMKGIMAAGPTVLGGLSFDGKALDGFATHRLARMGLSLVPEDRRIFPHLSVVENLQLARSAARPGVVPFTPQEMAERFPMLAPFMSRAGHALSGGQQQMVAIARGLISRPRLLLLDEPSEGLAPVIVEELASEIDRLRRNEGFSMLLAEQNIAFARHCTDRAIILDTGQVAFDGSWAEFDADPALLRLVTI